MAFFTDGKKLVSLEMVEWKGTGYGPDWSDDFFEFNNFNPDLGAHVVDDADYCIEVAEENTEYTVDGAELETFYTTIDIRIIKNGNKEMFATKEICKAIKEVDAYVEQETGLSGFDDQLLEVVEDNQALFHDTMDTSEINKSIIDALWTEASDYIEYIKANPDNDR